MGGPCFLWGGGGGGGRKFSFVHLVHILPMKISLENYTQAGVYGKCVL